MCLLYVRVYALLLITLPTSTIEQSYLPNLGGKTISSNRTKPIGFFVGTLYQIQEVSLADSFFMNIS